MKKIFVLLILLVFFPESAFSSSAGASVESGVVTGGKVDIRQSVEVTVNGQTKKLESAGPGKLELKMEQKGSSSPSVTFKQEQFTPVPAVSPSGQALNQNGSGQATPSAQAAKSEDSNFSLVTSIIEFVRQVFGNLSSFFKL